MALSSLPGSGPTIPAGAQKVSIKDMSTTANTKNVDVTVLGDNEHKYASPPLLDAASNISATCTASGLLSGSEPEVDPVATAGNPDSGWKCTDAEITYEVGKYATWSASWSYFD